MKELATALAKAQAKIKTAYKDSNGQVGNQKYKYADLSCVWDACKAALTENGFAVIQKPDFAGADMWLETVLLHTSGESITGRYPLRPQQQTPQGYGSALTYARRYSLAAMVGVVADEDDDGDAATNGHDDRPARRHEPVATPASTMAGRRNEAQGQRTAAQYKADCFAALAKIKTNAELTAWTDAERDTLEKLEKASRDSHTAIMDKVAETMDRVSPKRVAAE